MVRIVYSGNAEDFSCVVPVPDTPEFSFGANATFAELDFATRLQFLMQQEGSVCEIDQSFVSSVDSSDGLDAVAESDDSVTTEEQLSVRPFDIDIDIVSSNNADDMLIWLQDND